MSVIQYGDQTSAAACGAQLGSSSGVAGMQGTGIPLQRTLLTTREVARDHLFAQHGRRFGKTALFTRAFMAGHHAFACPTCSSALNTRDASTQEDLKDGRDGVKFIGVVCASCGDSVDVVVAQG